MSHEEWLGWVDLLLYLQFEQPVEWDWHEFRAEWARELLEGGKTAGLSSYVRR